MKKAVVTGTDTHPVRSLTLMLRSVGFDVVMLTDIAMQKLQKRGYTGGVAAEMLKNMGYVDAGLPPADAADLEDCDLFVDIKVPDADSMLKLYPRLEGKTAIFLINGGADGYEHYGEHYPTITSNFWIRGAAFKVWMPFDNIHGLLPRPQRMEFGPPIGLLHNAYNWGFRGILDDVAKETGLQVYGSYGSPAGILPNDKVGEVFSSALGFVHLKASDCPGYALYEAFARGVPVVVTQLLIERMKFHDLYEDGKTCLVWGKTSFKIEEGKITEFIDASRQQMIDDIVRACLQLKDPKLNHEIGMAGYKRWKKLTDWTEDKREAFASFLKENHLL